MSARDPDQLNILGLVEDPDRFEAVVADQHTRYAADPGLRALLDSIYYEPDRARAFARFAGNPEFVVIARLMRAFGLGPDRRVCEIGGGPGFLAWALHQAGWSRIELLEPNGHQVTGTGYFRSRPDTEAVPVHNDLAAWHAGTGHYDGIVTKNCIHHFKNIAQAAAAIRQKLRDGGRWLALREWFADSPAELYALIGTHPYCQPHGLYEWPYPASHYVEAIEIAGFKLVSVIPAKYANNVLATYVETLGPPEVQRFTAEIDAQLARDAVATVRQFWQEVVSNRFQGGQHRLWTRPQAMVFQRVPV